MRGEINYIYRGHRMRIRYDDETFYCLCVWGSYHAGKYDWDGKRIYENSCQHPAHVSRDGIESIDKAFDGVHKNIESNIDYLEDNHANNN